MFATLKGISKLAFCAAFICNTKLTFAETATIFEIRTGVGSFRDIQLPIWGDEFDYGDGLLRADGTVTKLDNGFHIGVPLQGGVTRKWLSGQKSLELSLIYTTLSHLAGDAELSASSYQKISLDVTPSIFLKTSGIPFFLGLKTSYVRSDYSNLTSAHAVTGLLTGPKIRFGKLDRLHVECDFLYDLVPSFHYRKSTAFFALEKMPEAEVRHQMIDLTISKSFKEAIVTELGLQHSSMNVFIPNLSSYSLFGLAVSPLSRRSKSYVLNTNILFLGIKKIF